MHLKHIYKVLYIDHQVAFDRAFHATMNYTLFTFLVMIIHFKCFLFILTIIIWLTIAFSHNYQHTLLNHTEIHYFYAHSITEYRSEDFQPGHYRGRYEFFRIRSIVSESYCVPNPELSIFIACIPRNPLLRTQPIWEEIVTHWKLEQFEASAFYELSRIYDCQTYGAEFCICNLFSCHIQCYLIKHDQFWNSNVWKASIVRQQKSNWVWQKREKIYILRDREKQMPVISVFCPLLLVSYTQLFSAVAPPTHIDHPEVVFWMLFKVYQNLCEIISAWKHPNW
jgi:hypothetical protein